MLECSNCGWPAAVGSLGLNCLRCNTGPIFRRKIEETITGRFREDNPPLQNLRHSLSSELTTSYAR